MSLVKQLIMVGCIFSACVKPPAHVKQAQEVTKEFAEKIEKETGLFSLGSGGFYTDKKIDSLYVDFEAKGNFSQNEARELLMNTMVSFVEFVNQNLEIRPFLSTYPITEKQISASIGFVDEKRVPVQGLSQIHLYTNTLYYSSFQIDTKQYVTYQKDPLF